MRQWCTMSNNSGSGFFAMTAIGAIILAPLIFFIYMLCARVGLEGLIVAFKTAENTCKTAGNTLPRIN